MNAGCAPKKALPAHPPLTSLQKKFELKCRKDYKLNVLTRLVGKTFWIYATSHDPLFEIVSASPSTPDPLKKPQKFALLYMNGLFNEMSFNLEYDVVPKTKSDLLNEGITEIGTDSFNKIYNNIFTAITETLLDPKTPASFIVIAICDIKRGIEARYTFYLEDYRKASVEAIPYEEFSKRVLQESTGNKDYIGDEIGQHLEYNDIRMPVFLTKQMINRVKFKFNQSDFPPQENYEDVIIGAVADVIRYYNFKEFSSIKTNDVRSKKKMIFSPKQLDFFGDDRPNAKGSKSNGKLIHIIFEDGKTTFKEQ